MIAALGETTAGPALPQLRDTMLSSPEGRKILKMRPRVNTQTIDMMKLANLPDGTFGRSYITWLERCGVTPDTREPVRSHLQTVSSISFRVHSLFRRFITSQTQNWPM